jgi:serine/threonine-protein kinase
VSRKIAGYRLGERLGQGSAGAVYLARDERLHYQVAVKVLGPDPARDLADTLVHEVRTAAALEHPHIIPVFDAGDEDGTAYIVMRYARGGDARSLLRRRGALPLAHAWRIIAQVASALDAAHAQGLVHRDVKPANILFDAADTVAGRRPGPGGDRVPAHAYLSDFGVGRVFPPGLVTGAEQLTDALDYLAPEQIEGDVLDGRADLYALACTSFELLCGAPPFGAEQGLTLMYSHLYAPPPVAAARRAGLPAAVDPVLARALAKDPAGRYPSCGRFAAELRAALGLGSVLRAGPAPSPGQTRPGPARVTAAPPAPAPPAPAQAGSAQAGSAQAGSAQAGSVHSHSAQPGRARTACPGQLDRGLHAARPRARGIHACPAEQGRHAAVRSGRGLARRDDGLARTRTGVRHPSARDRAARDSTARDRAACPPRPARPDRSAACCGGGGRARRDHRRGSRLRLVQAPGARSRRRGSPGFPANLADGAPVVTGVIAAARLPAGGRPGHAADLEFHRPDGAAPGRQAGRGVREPGRRDR